MAGNQTLSKETALHFSLHISTLTVGADMVLGALSPRLASFPAEHETLFPFLYSHLESAQPIQKTVTAHVGSFGERGAGFAAAHAPPLTSREKAGALRQNNRLSNGFVPARRFRVTFDGFDADSESLNHTEKTVFPFFSSSASQGRSDHAFCGFDVVVVLPAADQFGLQLERFVLCCQNSPCSAGFLVGLTPISPRL
jgi:hypothetical protein